MVVSRTHRSVLTQPTSDFFLLLPKQFYQGRMQYIFRKKILQNTWLASGTSSLQYSSNSFPTSGIQNGHLMICKCTESNQELQQALTDPCVVALPKMHPPRHHPLPPLRLLQLITGAHHPSLWWQWRCSKDFSSALELAKSLLYAFCRSPSEDRQTVHAPVTAASLPLPVSEVKAREPLTCR